MIDKDPSAEGDITMTNAGPAAPSTRIPEDVQRRIAAGRAVTTALGQMVSVLLRSKPHRNIPIGALETVLAPAIATRQFAVVEGVAGPEAPSDAPLVPVGLVLWAWVSPEIDRRLDTATDASARIQPTEWQSGDVLWLVEAVGEQKTIDAMIGRLTDTEWKGRSAKFRMKGADGQLVTRLTAPTKPPA
jgi:hemolysin-activating ACP:hemolysin acyltransferase